MSLYGNIAAEKTVATTWDVVVVGAGPAGAFLAQQLAASGLQVLLLEKQLFPRFKVCGGCVSAAALATLQKAGLSTLLDQCQANVLHSFELACKDHRVSLPLPEGRAISRAALDAALVNAAIKAGGLFLPGAAAILKSTAGGYRKVFFQHAHGEFEVLAKVVVGADGLAGTLRRDFHEFMAVPWQSSHIGAGAITEAGISSFPAGTIYMAYCRQGYAGIVRVEDNQLAIAAALAPGFVKDAGTIARAVGHVLEETGMPPLPNLHELDWQGTPALTRRTRRLSAARFFVLGDAAGYVEPFTGEGITWAINSAAALAPLVRKAIMEWSPQLELEWARAYHQVIGRRQAFCRIITRALRHPSLVEMMVRLADNRIGLMKPLINYLHNENGYSRQTALTVAVS